MSRTLSTCSLLLLLATGALCAQKAATKDAAKASAAPVKSAPKAAPAKTASSKDAASTDALAAGDAAWSKKSYAAALRLYRAALKAKAVPRARRPEVELRVVRALKRTGQWDAAFTEAGAFVQRYPGGVWEARGEALRMELYAAAPSVVWRVGDRLYRTVEGKLPEALADAYPERVDVEREDGLQALRAAERALALYAKLPQDDATRAETADLAADTARLVSQRFLSAWAAHRNWPAPADPVWTVDPKAGYQANWPAPRKVLQLYALAEQAGTPRQKGLARLESAVWLRQYQGYMSGMAHKAKGDGTWEKIPSPYEARKPVDEALRMAKEYPEHHEADYARVLAAAWLDGDGESSRALRIYTEILKNRPESPWKTQAAAGAAAVTRLGLALSSEAHAEPGKRASLAISARNVKTVKLAAHRVRLEELFKEGVFHARNASPEFQPLGGGKAGLKRLRALYQGDPVTWEAETASIKPQLAEGQPEGPRDPRAPVWGSVETPLLRTGAYVVEADGGPVRSLALLVVSDLAVTQLQSAGHVTAMVVNANTGAPVFDASVLLRETPGEESKEKPRLVSLKSGADGLAERDVDAAKVSRTPLLAWKGDRYAWTDGGSCITPEPETLRSAYVYTERPVYRPAQTVHFRALLSRREAEGVTWKPLPGEKTRVVVTGPNGAQVRALELKSNEFGSVHGGVELPAGAALGEYALTVSHVDGKAEVEDGSGSFRVEEYKKPEFEVTVVSAPGGKPVRAGQPARLQVTARYYWGAPVPKARVHLTTSLVEASPFGWPRSVFADEDAARVAGPDTPPDAENPHPLSGPVDLTATTDASGVATLTVPASATAVPSYGGALSVSVEVTDASRRVIQKAAEFPLPAAGFSASLHALGNFVHPGQPLGVELRTTDAEGHGVHATGEAIILRRVRNGDTPAWREVHREPVGTDGAGAGTIRWTPDQPGAYQIRFQAKDEDGARVTAETDVWVAGDQAADALPDGTDALIIPELGQYRLGTYPRVLILTRHAGMTALLSEVAGTRLVDKRVRKFEERSTEIASVLLERHQPDVTFQLNGVYARKAFTAQAVLRTPDLRGAMKLEVTADKATYRPGEQAVFHLRAWDAAGKPVRAECSLGVADASTFYIQGESTPPITEALAAPERGANVRTEDSTGVSAPERGEDDQPTTKAASLPALPRGLGTLADYPQHPRLFNFPQMNGSISSAGYPGGVPLTGPSLDMAPDPLRYSFSDHGKGVEVYDSDLARGRKNGDFYTARAVSEVSAKAAAPASLTVAPAPVVPNVGLYIRSQFADTAYWTPAAVTDASGEATVTFTWPDNLTQWRATGRGWTTDGQAGEGTADVATAKDLVVRLQAPRFFVERDECVLSANVHNYTGQDRRLQVALRLEGDTLVPAEQPSFGPARPRRVVVPRADEPQPEGPAFESGTPAAAASELSQWLDVPKGGERRVDWRVRVARPGQAALRVTAADSAVGDAMELRFPVEVHGIEKLAVKSGVLQPGGKPASARLTLTVPAERDPEAGALEVHVSPTLAGAMLDALPYLVDYPYGCVEQTMSRFLPAVVSARTLTELGVSLPDLQKRARAEWARRKDVPQDRPADSAYTYPEGAPGLALARRTEDAAWQWRAERSPVYNPELLKKISGEGLARLARMQHADGGWGWWESDASDTEMSAYVVRGLLLGRSAGLSVSPAMLDRGLKFLEARFAKLTGPHTLVNVGAVLSLDGKRAGGVAAALLQKVYPAREKLTPYGLALLAVALKAGGKAEEARSCVQALEKSARVDAEAGTCHWSQDVGPAWYWQNNDVETAAACLHALDVIEPKHRLAPLAARWLANNRQGGAWSTTRETALAVQALAEYVKLRRELEPDCTVTVDVDGKWKRSFRLTPANALLGDGALVIPAKALATGARTVTVSRTGEGSVYYSAVLRSFTLEEGIRAAGNELRVRRRYFRLVRPEAGTKPATALTPDGYERRAVQPGERLRSGDLLEVELLVESGNNYSYVVFEDMKPAGCEAVDLRSGADVGDGACSNVELRDQKVALFFTELAQGKHRLHYRLRAEVPGSFHSLPVNGYAMYAPQVRCISDETLVGIEDAEQQAKAETAPAR